MGGNPQQRGSGQIRLVLFRINPGLELKDLNGGGVSDGGQKCIGFGLRRHIVILVAQGGLNFDDSGHRSGIGIGIARLGPSSVVPVVSSCAMRSADSTSPDLLTISS